MDGKKIQTLICKTRNKIVQNFRTAIFYYPRTNQSIPNIPFKIKLGTRFTSNRARDSPHYSIGTAHRIIPVILQHHSLDAPVANTGLNAPLATPAERPTGLRRGEN